jgi:hypothetical protein
LDFDRLIAILHHAEAVDPDLVNWIQHRIDAVTGLEPSALVIVFGMAIVAFPLMVSVMFLVRRRAFRRSGHGGDRADGSGER